MRTSRADRLLSVSVLASVSLLGMPPAQAVSPPQISDRWLPKPARPVPPWPTVQREVCATMTTGSAPDRPTDLLDLSRVWQLTRGAGQRVAVIDTGVSRHRLLPDVVPGGDFCPAATAPGLRRPRHPGGRNHWCDSGFELQRDSARSDLDQHRQSSAKFSPASDRSRAGVGDVDTMAKAVRTAADLGASVINISSVACVPVASAPDDRALGAALAYAVDVKNAVIVAAAGNTGGPGQCPPSARTPAGRPSRSRSVRRGTTITC